MTNLEFSNELIAIDTKRLINQLWKLIPMRENDEHWQEHLKTVTEEISGLGIVLNKELDFLVLLSKLYGLTSEVCEDFMLYRKTVFRCIDLLIKVTKYHG